MCSVNYGASIMDMNLFQTAPLLPLNFILLYFGLSSYFLFIRGSRRSASADRKGNFEGGGWRSQEVGEDMGSMLDHSIVIKPADYTLYVHCTPLICNQKKTRLLLMNTSTVSDGWFRLQAG